MRYCLFAGVLGLSIAGVVVGPLLAAQPNAATEKEPYPSATPQAVVAVTDKVFAGAKPTEDNAYKLKLAERTLGAVLTEARA